MVPNKEEKEIIDSIVIEVTHVFKEKILDLIEPLCLKCKLEESDEAFDSDLISDVLITIAQDKKDVEFL